VIRKLFASLAACAAVSPPATAADPAPVRLAVKPLLCVLDKTASSCMMTFDIRWKSVLANEYCLNDSTQGGPVHCWTRAVTGVHTLKREVSEEFVYWLGAPDGADHLSEVKITVLRVGSTDRRRERRTRHVWDVL
jgi:hypothetical protein